MILIMTTTMTTAATTAAAATAAAAAMTTMTIAGSFRVCQISGSPAAGPFRRRAPHEMLHPSARLQFGTELFQSSG